MNKMNINKHLIGVVLAILAISTLPSTVGCNIIDSMPIIQGTVSKVRNVEVQNKTATIFTIAGSRFTSQYAIMPQIDLKSGDPIAVYRNKIEYDEFTDYCRFS